MHSSVRPSIEHLTVQSNLTWGGRRNDKPRRPIKSLERDPGRREDDVGAHRFFGRLLL